MNDSGGRRGPRQKPTKRRMPSTTRSESEPQQREESARDAASAAIVVNVEDGQPFVIPELMAGKTVLAVLRLLRQGESWSKLQSRMHQSYVTLNGVVCIDEARRVSAGDTLVLGNRPGKRPPDTASVVIRYWDPHVVVVEKPAGMMTHRRPEERHWSTERKRRQPTLDEALNELLSQRTGSRRAGRSRPNVRCVHRLDRDTSGLLVFARSEAAEAGLVSQFRHHAVHRVYWTIVHGTPTNGTIVSNLVRDRGDGRRGSVSNVKMGQRAVTHVRCLETYGDFSLVECRLETGRTNQIRIHLAEAGHVVCGDPKYNQPLGQQAADDSSGAPRLALHAAELGFVHPISGEELFFQMEFPPDLAKFESKLRGK